MVRVSVCITTYNHAPFIAQALDSVLMQETDFDYEIILGEDGSQDGTRAICIEYARRYPDRIRLFLRSRQDVISIHGRPTGRYNFVENLKATQGEYVALLDGDDYWTDPLKLQKQVSFLEAHPDCSMCFHHIFRLNHATGEMQIERQMRPQPFYVLDDVIRQRVHVPTASMMLRSDVISELASWFYHAPVGDTSLVFLSAQKGSIGLIDQVMAVYRFYGAGLWQRTSAATRQQMVDEMFAIFREQLGPGYEKQFRCPIARHHLNRSRLNADSGDLVSAKADLRKSFQTFFSLQGPWLGQLVMLGRLCCPRLYKLAKWILKKGRPSPIGMIRAATKSQFRAIFRKPPADRR